MGMSGRFVQPAQAIHASFQDQNGFQVMIPTRKRIFLIVFLSIWLAGFAFMGCGIFGISLANSQGSIMDFFIGDADTLFGIPFWTVISGVFFLILLWQVRGHEVVTINKEGINLRKEVFSKVGWSNYYSREYMKDFRIAPYIPALFGWGRSLHHYGLAGGFLAFDYGAKTIHFGAGVDEAEAKQIYQEIINHYPKYGRVQS